MPEKEPVDFTEDIGLRVCGLIAQGYSLRKVEQEEGMPSKSGILKWLLEGEAYRANGQPEHPKAQFVDQYARAREVQADCLADDIVSIADDSQFDTVTENGKVITNLEHIQRDRLRVDARKWVASKLKPKKYGDKTVIAGAEDKPVKVEHLFADLTIEDLKKLAKVDA